MCVRECGECQHWREREKRRERTKERRREREKKEKEGEGEGELSLFYSHFLLFRTRYASLHICFWTHSDDVATLFPSSSLSHSLSHSLSISSTHILNPTHSLLLSLSLINYFPFSLSLSSLSSLFCFGPLLTALDTRGGRQ